MLLHATLAAAEPLGLGVLALHVHHGLSTHADEWLEHCRDRCRRQAARGRALAFAATRLATRPAAGESVEAWARRERYRALAEMARAGGAGLVLLGHHRRDQAETFLLQALRGGGVAALAAMPVSVDRDDVTWARPLLGVPAAAVGAYARRHRLRWVEDDSNADERFARNRLRARVWPALTAAFPDAESALAMAATWVQQAATIATAVVAQDLAAVSDGDRLHIARWRETPAPRRSHVLRAWLHQRCGTPAPPSLTERLLDELDDEAVRRWPAPGGVLHSYRGWLSFEQIRKTPTRATETPKATTRERPTRDVPSRGVSPVASAMRIDLSHPGRHEVHAWHGSFQVDAVAAGGLPVSRAAALELRARIPADRFQAGPGRPPRSLKLQFQAAGVPARQRMGPVVCSEGALAYVPGLGIDARVRAATGDAQVVLTWCPD